ncbi:MAG: sialidase family protein [Polyangiaceae bacterium]
MMAARSKRLGRRGLVGPNPRFAGAVRLLLAGTVSFGLQPGERRAAANGRFPASNQIVFSPADPNVVVGRTTYAVLPSRDDGATWSYICEDALGLPTTAYQDPELGLSANGSLVAGLYFPTAGVDVSNDLGCNWSCAGGPLANQSIADVVVRPDTPAAVLALTSTSVPVDAGGGNFSQVFLSTDNGTNWTALGVALDPDVLAQTIDVAASDPSRIYVSGTRGFGAGRTASLFVSADDAAHWTEHPLPDFDPSSEDSIYIGAVDPTDADRVYIRSSSLATGGRSRLFVTGDGGNSFQVVKQFDVPDPGVLATEGELLGFALSPDGSKVYAGTKGAGLFVANKADLAFQMKSSIHVQCLTTRGSELWACSDEVSGFVFGVSTDDGATFCPKLSTITGLAGPIACAPNAGGPLACGATTNGSQCLDAFSAFCSAAAPSGSCSTVASECSTPADGGDVVLPDSSLGQPPRGRASGGCSVARDSRAPGVGAACLSGVVALVRRRKRDRGAAPLRPRLRNLVARMRSVWTRTRRNSTHSPDKRRPE